MYRLEKATDYIRSRGNHRVDLCRIFATRLGKIRPSSARSADHWRERLHNVSRLDTAGDISGDAGYHGDLAFGGRSGQEDDARGKL